MQTRADRQHHLTKVTIMKNIQKGILKILPKPPNSISSPLQVLEMLKDLSHTASSCRLVSLDVEAMFPSIPTSQAVPLIQDLLQTHHDALAEVTSLKPVAVADLLQLSINNCQAVIQDGDRQRWFRQTSGLAMGKSYSPIVADLYMGVWEQDLQQQAAACGGTVLKFCRYADDYLALFVGSDEALRTWVQVLNSKNNNIKVTSELEENQQLPYLDILIRRERDKFHTTVYRKACATNQVPAYNSFTEMRYLTSAIRSDSIRAHRYCSSTKDREKELNFIRHKFHQHGYPLTIINTTISKACADLKLKARALPAPADSNNAPQPIRLSMPFAGSCFYQLKRAAYNIGIQLVSKPQRTVASVLCSKAKHHLPKEQDSNIVYLIECSCSVDGDPVIYIGETDRELQTRVKEHQDSWAGGVRSRSATSAFSTHRTCTPAFDRAEVLHHASHPQLRLLLESAYIRTVGRRETVLISPNDANVNRNSGTRLQDRWLPIIRPSCTRPTT